MSESAQPQKNYTTPLLVVLLIGAAFAIGMMWQRMQNLEKNVAAKPAAGQAAAQVAGEEAQAPADPTVDDIRVVTDEDYVRGDANAPLTLIEYSDFECPFCQRVQPDVTRVMSEYAGKVRLVYRHFPLRQIHPSAEPLARAAECIGESGDDAFWKFHDALFAQQAPGLDPVAVAQKLGMNTTNMKTCMDSEDTIARVEEDYQDGLQAGVQGTPHFVLMDKNGTLQLIRGAVPFDQFKTSIESML